ncbi:unnamed protein product [Symbiodinium natans]|uniref:Uncharacterized protein n=1 Tax=Symbiodinium natans TaxID=878477 RepID=A0A812UEJ1_9DINO|nr:unnamed protein product [Symbiodinium natans]
MAFYFFRRAVGGGKVVAVVEARSLLPVSLSDHLVFSTSCKIPPTCRTMKPSGAVLDPPLPPEIPGMEDLNLSFPKLSAGGAAHPGNRKGRNGRDLLETAGSAGAAAMALALLGICCLRRARKIREAEAGELRNAA